MGKGDENQPATEEIIDAKRRFQAARAEGTGTTTAFSVAHHAMADTGPVSEENWEGDPAGEVDNWVQEELYVHAKLLIVDDRIVVCGSSNLNDRSQTGHHDSELSIVMEDTDLIDSVMDGQTFKAGRHAATLRRYLWREHMGLLPPQPLHADESEVNAQPPGENSPNDPWDRDDSYKFVEDPMSEDLWNMWTERATTNTDTFRHLFHADPDDNSKHEPCFGESRPFSNQTSPVKTFEDYDQFLPSKAVKSGHVYDRFMPPEDLRRKLDDIKGHLVWFPLEFLQDVNMAEFGLQVNQFTESVYT